MTNKHVNKRLDKKRSKKRSLIRNFIPRIPNFGPMLFGFLLGVFCSFLAVFMFATTDITLKFPSLGAKQPLRVAAAKPVVVAPTPVQEPRFDFYTELAKSEDNRTLDINPAPKDLKISPKAIHGYIVQAGTYRKAADADAVRARLTLNGYAAKIDHVKLNDGNLLHRVLLGNFKNEKQAKDLQQKLKNLQIDSVLVLKYSE